MSIILEGIDLPNNGQIELIIRPHGKVFSKTRGISARAIQIDSVPSADDCDGCRYHDLGPTDDPCYECRRNYYDRYEEEAEETEEEDEDVIDE